MGLRVLSYNIQHGGVPVGPDGRLDPERGPDRVAAIAEVIRGEQPDLVALQEANSRSNAEWLAKQLGMSLAYGEANSAFAVAWLSRLPILSSQNHRLPSLAKTLLEIDVVWDGAPLYLFATHLVAGRREPDGERRAGEARDILAALEGRSGRRHLLVGDFNAVHPGDSFGQPPGGQPAEYIARRPIQHILDAGYVDCFRHLHPDEPGYTYEATHPWVRIDYLFASPGLAERVQACDVVTSPGAERASDHLPLHAELR
jgi:endonuclease/exonuclease/phosphatase family metal-dependent hydrolase